MSCDGAKLLLVDDSAVLRKMAATNLMSLGEYEIDQAAGGVEALELMLEKDYDLLITDYYMPGMDGIELVRRVRRSTDGREIPIVMLTMERDRFVEQEARAAGVQEFLVKPLEPAMIRTTLDSLLCSETLVHQPRKIEAGAILDAFPFPAMVLDRHHTIVVANHAFWSQTGTGLDDTAVRCAIAMHASQQQPVNCPLVKSVRTGAPAEEVVIEGDMKLLVSVYPMDLFDDEGHPLYLHLARPML